MIITEASFNALYRGLKREFMGAFEGYKPTWDKFCRPVNSATSEEIYPFRGDVPSLRLWVGPRQIKEQKIYEYRLENHEFEYTEAIDLNKIEDDHLRYYGDLFSGYGDSAGRHPDELFYNALKNGTTELCYDALPFFSAAHPIETGSSYSNLTAGAGAPWYLLDTSRPLRPLIMQIRKRPEMQQIDQVNSSYAMLNREIRLGIHARTRAGYGLWQLAHRSSATLDEAGFVAARAAMQSTPTPEGNVAGVMPTVLVCGVSNQSAAENVLLAAMKASGASNTLYKAVDLHVSPYLP